MRGCLYGVAHCASSEAMCWRYICYSNIPFGFHSFSAFYILFTLYILFILSVLFIFGFIFCFILSSLLTFFCHPLLTDAQHAAQSPLHTLNQGISIPDIRI